MTTIADNQIIAATQEWVKTIVVGFNFCPFAKKEVQRETIRYKVCHESSSSESIQVVLDELYLLDQQSSIETTLIILPSGFEDFDEFLDLVDLADSIIDQAGYRGIYQLATFHPDYCFEGLAADAAANCTNRAPYPTLHLIREASVERVLKQFPDPESIPVANGKKAEELGLDYFERFLARVKLQP